MDVAKERVFPGFFPESAIEHDPEKWVAVFPRDKRGAFARKSCSKGWRSGMTIRRKVISL
jgi:hypothetical protein